MGNHRGGCGSRAKSVRAWERELEADQVLRCESKARDGARRSWGELARGRIEREGVRSIRHGLQGIQHLPEIGHERRDGRGLVQHAAENEGTVEERQTVGAVAEALGARGVGGIDFDDVAALTLRTTANPPVSNTGRFYHASLNSRAFSASAARNHASKRSPARRASADG